MTYKLVCFDLDGTLIEEGAGGLYWYILHRRIEGEESLRRKDERIAAYRAGELTYHDWFNLDVRGLRDAGGTKEDFIAAAQECELITGAWDAVHELKRRGYKLALISHSLNPLLDTLFPDHPFDDVHINTVEFDEEGRLARWHEAPYEEKYHSLLEICSREGISLSETVFVGDGWNDVDILREAGLGIAFCPQEDIVREAADVVVEKKDVWEVVRHITGRTVRRPRS